jgi:FAD/FMN-containing dehydrogenase
MSTIHEARAAAVDLRALMRQRLHSSGCAHVQLGKIYGYRDALAGNAAWDMLEQLKDVVDRDRMLNPGALGLGK